MTITPINDTTPAPGWVQLQLDLRRWTDGWIREMRERHDCRPWKHGHDEGIFTRTLPAFYLVTGYKPAMEFSEMLADQFLGAELAEACTCFLTREHAAEFGDNELVEKYHGYQADQSCLVHGPENYCWFLSHIAQASDDPKYAKALEDTAEHIGNFSPDTPPWYDWENHRFRSALLGTKRVRDYPPYDYETLTHVRVMVQATNTYALTDDTRYLDLAINWLDKWAGIVLNSEDGFPYILYPAPDEEVDQLYGEFANHRRTTVQYELAHMFLDIHRISPHDKYTAAVCKMIDESLENNDLQMGLLLAKYRSLTGDTHFDSRALALADASLEQDESVPGLIVIIDRDGKTPYQHVDYVTVADGSTATKDNRSVSMLACAYQITGDTRYIESSLRLAWMRFWASWYLWDGRELGCRGSWSGRNGIAMNNVIPALNMSASGGFGMLEGELPWMDVFYRQQDGSIGLPEKVAALYNNRTIHLANTNPEPRTIYIKSGTYDVSIPKLDDTWAKVEVPGMAVVDVEM